MIVRKDFLIQCRKQGVFPPHIVNTIKCVHPLLEDRSPFIPKLQRIVERFKKALLNVEIKHTFHMISRLTDEREQARRHVEATVSQEISSQFIITQQKSFTNTMDLQRRKTQAKLNRIVTQRSEQYDATPSLNELAVTNSTKLSIPIQMQTLLSLGPKFALPTQELQTPMFHLIADTEAVLKLTPEESIQNRNRCQVVTHIQNHLARNKSERFQAPVQKFCKEATRITRSFLKEHENVVVLESDKGKKMVIMYRDDYDRKMKALLEDNTYQVVSKDPTTGFQTKNNRIVTRLLDLKLIDRPTARQLKTTTSVCPRIYGQPKAHKPNLPLRPVVPNITAPTYQLSKYIASILKQAVTSEYNIIDSFDFVNYINTVTLPQGYVLVSFDVVSLFTNIPKDLVLHDIIQNWNDIKVNTHINLDLFLEIVEFCLNSSYFCFRGKYYIQKFGTAMGSPLSPILADLVMNNLLKTVTKDIGCAIPVLKKYVDDLILALPTDQIQTVLQSFNNYNLHLQFTYETESNNKLPFLDTLITRNADQSLNTSWYSKPIASGRLLNYHSFHTTAMKINIAVNFIDRVSKLTTNQSIGQQKHIIFQHLRKNNYPATLINRLLCRIYNRRRSNPTSNGPSSFSNRTSPVPLPPLATPQTIGTPSTEPPTDASPTITQDNASSPDAPPPTTPAVDDSPPPEILYRSIPFIPQLTTNIAHTLKRDYPNIKLAYRTTRTTKHILKQVKDPVAKTERSKVIYSIPCNDCEMTYIGMTKNKLKTRLSGHQTHINKLEKLRQTNTIQSDDEITRLRETTALMDHTIQNNHKFDLTKTTILDQARRESALPVLEMCHITNTPHTVNYRTDVDNLNSTYAGILHTIKNYRSRKQRQTDLDNNTQTQTTR